MTLRQSVPDNLLSQKEILDYMNTHEEEIFNVIKVGIQVHLTKAVGGEVIKTNVLARDGRVIEETQNTAKPGYGIDSRKCINGKPNQYAKTPEKVVGLYQIEGGRSFADIAPGETVNAITTDNEQRQALVAQEDLYIAATWGEIQYVAKGGLITIFDNEAIGNNNPCDMVMTNKGKQGTVPLTENMFKVRADLNKQGVEITSAMEKFMEVAAGEDRKNP